MSRGHERVARVRAFGGYAWFQAPPAHDLRYPQVHHQRPLLVGALQQGRLLSGRADATLHQSLEVEHPAQMLDGTAPESDSSEMDEMPHWNAKRPSSAMAKASNSYEPIAYTRPRPRPPSAMARLPPPPPEPTPEPVFVEATLAVLEDANLVKVVDE